MSSNEFFSEEYINQLVNQLGRLGIATISWYEVVAKRSEENSKILRRLQTLCKLLEGSPDKTYDIDIQEQRNVNTAMQELDIIIRVSIPELLGGDV